MKYIFYFHFVCPSTWGGGGYPSLSFRSGEGTLVSGPMSLPELMSGMEGSQVSDPISIPGEGKEGG